VKFQGGNAHTTATAAAKTSGGERTAHYLLLWEDAGEKGVELRRCQDGGLLDQRHEHLDDLLLDTVGVLAPGWSRQRGSGGERGETQNLTDWQGNPELPHGMRVIVL